jgi:hypothetical protein
LNEDRPETDCGEVEEAAFTRMHNDVLAENA